MWRMAIVGVMLAIIACSSSRPSVSIDASDAASVDGGSDAGSDTSFVCGGPVIEGPCLVQDPSEHAGCGSEGRVVFDGAHCVAARGETCVDPRGGFVSLEQCAIACERAGHCDGEKIVDAVLESQVLGCEAPPEEPPCPDRYVIRSLAPLDSCALLADELSCAYSPERRHWICSVHTARSLDGSVIWPILRRFSLMDTTIQAGCGRRHPL